MLEQYLQLKNLRPVLHIKRSIVYSITSVYILPILITSDTLSRVRRKYQPYYTLYRILIKTVSISLRSSKNASVFELSMNTTPEIASLLIFASSPFPLSAAN